MSYAAAASWTPAQQSGTAATLQNNAWAAADAALQTKQPQQHQHQQAATSYGAGPAQPVANQYPYPAQPTQYPYHHQGFPPYNQQQAQSPQQAQHGQQGYAAAAAGYQQAQQHTTYGTTSGVAGAYGSPASGGYATQHPPAAAAAAPQWNGNAPPARPPNSGGGSGPPAGYGYTPPASAWAAQKDPKTGATYYYNSNTKVSTWTCPPELTSAVNAALPNSGHRPAAQQHYPQQQHYPRLQQAANPNPNQWQWSTGKPKEPQQLPVQPGGYSAGGVKFGLKKKQAAAQQYGAASAFNGNDDDDEAFISANKPKPQPKSGTGQTISADQWPASLKKYVERAFADCKSDVQRDTAEKHLRQIILHATKTNTMFTKDWLAEPLPSDKPLPSLKSPNATNAYQQYPFNKQQQQQQQQQGNGKGGKKRKKGKKVFELNEDDHTLNSRANRFAATSKRPRRVSNAYIPPVEESGFSLSASEPIRGLCRDLEKPYLRTSGTKELDPLEVRPPAVLVESLEHVMRKWKQESNYKWTCDQMKSIRQDLQVQWVRTDFTVKVYETHARIALEKADHSEFNQCQVNLRHLYQGDVKGSYSEFMGYRILYNLFTNSHTEMLTALTELMEPGFAGNRASPSIVHALKTREACSDGNYMKFFRLYNEAPLMGGYLIDWFILRERKKALLKITHAFRPQVEIATLTEWLAFEDRDSCLDFLEDLKVVFELTKLGKRYQKTSINCKDSYPLLVAASQKTMGVAAWAQ